MRDEVKFLDSFGLANPDIEKELYEESFKYKGDDLRSKKFSKKLSRLIDVYELPKGFNKTLYEQLVDENFRQKVVEETLKHYDPVLKVKQKDICYELEFVGAKEFKIHSSIEFNETISITSPLLALVNALEEMQVMAEYASESSLSEFHSKLIRLKTESVVAASTHSAREIEVFNHYVFDDSWALREAINKKQLHVKAILPALRKAERFKKWLKDLPSDANLINEYFEKVEEKTVLERLPAKAIRFYVFNGLGAILNAVNPELGLSLNLAASFFDTFILENLKKDWKPNQFVKDEFRDLLDSNKKK